MSSSNGRAILKLILNSSKLIKFRQFIDIPRSLLEQLKHCLLVSIGLGQHRCSSLLHDLGS